jgi:hypothetical protein
MDLDQLLTHNSSSYVRTWPMSSVNYRIFSTTIFLWNKTKQSKSLFNLHTKSYKKASCILCSQVKWENFYFAPQITWGTKQYVSYLYFSMIIPYNPQSPKKIICLDPLYHFSFQFKFKKKIFQFKFKKKRTQTNFNKYNKISF